jgi:hypothetical protein
VCRGKSYQLVGLRPQDTSGKLCQKISIFLILIINSFCVNRLKKKKDDKKPLEVITIKKSTDLSKPGLNLNSLSEHEVDCGHGLISQFKIEMTGETYKINYQCMIPDSKKCNPDCIEKIKITDKENCSLSQSKTVDSEKNDLKSIIPLSTIGVECKAGTALKKFRLRFSKDSPPKMHYDYVCCQAKVNACGKKSTQVLSFKDQDKTIIGLSRFDVSVDDLKSQALNGFNFKIDMVGKEVKSRFETLYCSIFG